MKVKLLWVFVLFMGINAMAQDQNWSVEVSYPINITSSSDTFNTDGVIDLGIKYRFVDLRILKLGIGVNGGFYREIGETDRFYNFQVDIKNYFVQPKLFTDFKIPTIPKLHPSLGIGYSILFYDDTFINNTMELNANGSKGGLNLNLGLSYDFYKRLFVQAQFDFITVGYDEEDGNSYVRRDEIGVVKLGIGFRF